MIKKILIIQLRPGLGDLCMFLPRCHEIGRLNKNSEITLLTKKNTKADHLLKNDPYIKSIEFIDDENVEKKNLISLFKFFKKHKFEKVYSYQYGPKYLKYIFLSKITGVKEIFFYGIFKKKEGMTKRSILANEKWLNIKINDFKGKIYLDKNDTNKNRSIVIGLGASGDNKRWPLENFIELINKLEKYKDYLFILAGGPGESIIIEKIVSSLPEIKFKSLEKLNVSDCIKEINGSIFFIGNDTGFMHVSACLGIKTFCLYGDTPSIDSHYNENIIPILPPGMSKVYHNDLAMDKISVDLTFKTISKKITESH